MIRAHCNMYMCMHIYIYVVVCVNKPQMDAEIYDPSPDALFGLCFAGAAGLAGALSSTSKSCLCITA